MADRPDDAGSKTEGAGMTDDLVKRLRSLGSAGPGRISFLASEDAMKAADRIEKLVAGEIEFDRVIGNYASENAQFRDRIEKLEAALRNVTKAWDIWQKAKDSNSFTELFASICEAKALEGKDG